MLKLKSACLIGFVASLFTTPALAQIPTMTGVSSGTAVQNFRSVSYTESEVWGDFAEFGVSVNSAVAGTFAVDFEDLDAIVNISTGGVAGINLYEIDGGFYNFTETDTRITGRNVTSTTNFN